MCLWFTDRFICHYDGRLSDDCAFVAEGYILRSTYSWVSSVMNICLFLEVMIILFEFGISSLGNVNGSCRAILKKVRFSTAFVNDILLIGL